MAANSGDAKRPHSTGLAILTGGFSRAVGVTNTPLFSQQELCREVRLIAVRGNGFRLPAALVLSCVARSLPVGGTPTRRG